MAESAEEEKPDWGEIPERPLEHAAAVGPLPMPDAKPRAPGSALLARLCPWCADEIIPGVSVEDNDPVILVVPERGTWREYGLADVCHAARRAHLECYRLWRERIKAARAAARAVGT